MVYSVFDKPQNLLGTTVPPVASPVAPTGVLPPPVDTRTLISQTAKPGFISGFDTQNNYAPVFVPKGQYVAGISATGKEMTTGSLAPVPGFTLPSGEQGNQMQLDQQMAAAKAYSDGQAKLKADELTLNPPPTKEANQFQDILNNMVTGANEAQLLPGQQLAAEQAGGIPQLNQQKAQIDTQIAQKIAEGQVLDASYQQANTEAEGRPITLSRLAGEKAANYRNYLAQKNSIAAEAGLLSALSQGLNGQIQVAQSTANRAIDLKYQSIIAQRETYQMQLNALKPLLTAQEKKQADLQQQRLDTEKQQLTEKKAEEKSIQGLMLEAASRGASSAVLSAISGAKTLTEASQVFSSLVRQQVVPSGGTGGQPSQKEVTAATQAAEVASQAQAQVTLADDILSSSGFTGAVGPNRLARFRPIAGLTGSTSNFIASVEQLTNQQTLKTLTDLKKAGGTLGALSEKELVLLQDSATKINNWALKDKNGKVYAYQANEKDFKVEINRIKTLAQKAIDNASTPILNDNDPLNLGIVEDPLKLF